MRELKLSQDRLLDCRRVAIASWGVMFLSAGVDVVGSVANSCPPGVGGLFFFGVATVGTCFWASRADRLAGEIKTEGDASGAEYGLESV